MDATFKPYLIRAFWSWCEDSGIVPYLSVFVDDRVHVPNWAVNEGRIVLNISSEATQYLLIDNEAIHFEGRFRGQVVPVWVPVSHVLGIFAKDDPTVGFGFEVDKEALQSATPNAPNTDAPEGRPPPSSPATPGRKSSGPSLKRIK